MDATDWESLKHMIVQAMKAADREDLDEYKRADAAGFATLGLAIVDIHDRLERLNTASHKPLVDAFGMPLGDTI